VPHETIPTVEPTRLVAGESWQWDRYLSDHLPSVGWELTYFLRQGAAAAIVLTTSAGADDQFELRHTGNSSKDYPPGLYRLVGRVELTSGERFIVHDSYITVEPDPVEGTPSGTFAEQMVAKIETELLALSTTSATQAVRRWKQGDREEETAAIDRQYLMEQLGYWREEVRQQRTGKLFQSVRGQFV
jgi:hypothetical protein